MIQYELLLELREFIAEHINTCFFTNYSLEHKGVELNDFTELSSLDLESDQKIYMRPKLYDEKSARHHVRRVTEILTKPTMLNAQQNGQEEEENELQDLINKCKADGISQEETDKKV